MKLLILDNYDSFTYNLVHLVEKVGDISFDVFQNDKVSLKQIESYDKILLSPGPGLPSEAGIMPELINRFHKEKSIFGVCLGLQAIGEGLGFKLKNLANVYHGIATEVNIIGEDSIFKNCPQRFKVGRYHSWVIDEKTISNEVEITATDDSGLIMALKHKKFDLKGVQFHPESILSEHGETLIRNWVTR